MKRLLVALLAALVITSTAAGASLAGSPLVAATEPTPIESCTGIDTSGEYILANNITGAQDGCIQITADNVTLDGNGHTIAGEETGITATDVEAVTITNITLDGFEESAVVFESVSNGTVADATINNPEKGVVVRDSEGFRIVRTNITDMFMAGVELESTNNSLISENSFQDGFSYRTIELVDSHNNQITQNTGTNLGNRFMVAEESNGNAIVNNTITNSYAGISVSGEQNRVVENRFENLDSALFVGGSESTATGNVVKGSDMGISVGGSANVVSKNEVFHTIDFAIKVDGDKQTITNNHIHGGGDGIAGTGGGVLVEGANQTIANNNISGAVNGVKVQFSNGTIEIVHNNLESFQRGVWVADEEREFCGQKQTTNASFVEVHDNVIADDGYHFYGVLNEANGVVNATGNYWGATDGPSSPDDKTITDPKTGREADGNGTTVSDGVRFDPFLTTDPTTDDAQSDA